MKRKIHDAVAILLCALALALTTTAFTAPGCSPEQRRSAGERVVAGLDVAARAVAPGIETVRAFRVAGKVDAATSLKLAQGALEVNSAAARLTQSALDGHDAPTLAAQLAALINLARGLQSDGTLHIKNEGTRLVFDLSVVVAENGLDVALRDLRREGVSFTVDPETRERLLGLKPVFEENDRLLREAMGRLSGP